MIKLHVLHSRYFIRQTQLKIHINTTYLSQTSLILRILWVSDGLLSFLDEVGGLVHHVTCMVNNRVLKLTIAAGCRDAADGRCQHPQCARCVTSCYTSVVLVALQANKQHTPPFNRPFPGLPR